MTKETYAKVENIIKSYGVVNVTPFLVAVFCEGIDVIPRNWTKGEVLSHFAPPLEFELEE